MKKNQLENISASVHQRLLNKSKESSRPFNELLQYYAMERFLYRLSKSPHAEKFVVKGALMLPIWEAPLTRPTMDIDMLGGSSDTVGEIVSVVSDGAWDREASAARIGVIMRDTCHLGIV